MDDGGGGGGGDESRAGLYPYLLDRFQSLEASQQKLRQQFEVVLQEETTKKGPASNSGGVTSFPDWGSLPGAYFSGSPYRNVLDYMGHVVHVCSRIRSWEITVISWEPLMERYGEKLRNWGTKKKRNARVPVKLPEKESDLSDWGGKGLRKPRNGKGVIFRSGVFGNTMMIEDVVGDDVVEGN